MKIRKTFIFLFVVLFLAMASDYTISAQGENNQSNFTLDAATRSQVIEGVIKRFNQSYVFPEVAKAMEKSVRERMRKGEYDKITSPTALAEMLTSNLRQISKDTHIEVVFSNKPLPPMNEVEREETEVERENRRLNYARTNNGFLKVERLPGNIGFLDIDQFVAPTFAGDTAAAAMNFLTNTDALIVDLRYCPGGSTDGNRWRIRYLRKFTAKQPVLCGLIFRVFPATRRRQTIFCRKLISVFCALHLRKAT